MSLIYQQYYRRFGVRRLQSLLAPTLIELTELPRNCLVHYAIDPVNPDIDISKFYLRNYSKRILVDYIDSYMGIKGTPKRRPLQVKNLVKDWLIQHKQFKYLIGHYKINNDVLTLLINNYNYLHQLYRYVDLPLTPYYKFWNIHDTLWHTVNNIADQCSREQFVFLSIPDQLPSFTFLNMFSTRINPSMLKLFDTDEKLMLLELWKWLNPDTRDTSIMNQLDKKNYSKVTLVLVNKNNQSLLINLAYLNSWIEGQDNQTEFKSVTQIKPLQLSKVFLRTLMLSHSVDTETLTDVNVTTPLDEADQQEKQLMEEETDEFLSEHNAAEEEPMDDSALASGIQKMPKKPLADYSEDEQSDSLANQLTNIDDDIKLLDVINNKQLMNKGIKLNHNGEEVIIDKEIDRSTPEEVQAKFLQPKSVNDSLTQLINEQAEIGSITANDYRNLIKEINSFDSKKDPYGSNKTRLEASTIKPEELAINQNKTQLADIDVVLDKGMLQSSLMSYHSDYIANVLKKDVLNMTAGIQKSGVVIKNHEMEVNTSILGSYEIHTLELKPVNGASSIIRFRLPVIKEDATYEAGGNKYILRSQRVD